MALPFLSCHSSHPLEQTSGIGSAQNLSFGRVIVGESAAATLVVENLGTGPFDFVSTPSFAGGAAADFSVLSIAPATLDANRSATFLVGFAPTAAGERSAILDFDTDSRLTPTFGASIDGTGVDPATLTLAIAPQALDFGAVHLPLTARLNLLLTTNGQDPLPLHSLTITGPQASSFAATLPGPGALAPSEQFELPVSFTPQAIEPAQATLTLTACRLCAPQSVALSGQGINGVLAFRPSGLQFGTIRHNQQVGLPISVLNKGASDIVVTGLQTETDAGFAVLIDGGSPFPLDLFPGQEFRFVVTYQTTGVVGAIDTDHLVAHAGYGRLPLPDVNAPLTGEVGSDCVLGTDPSQIDFDFAVPGAYSPQQVLTLTNGGRDTCVLSGFALGAASDQGFSIVATPDGGVIAPFGSASVVVAFGPRDASAPWRRNATLGFASNDPYNLTVRVALTGKAQSDAYAHASAWPRWGHDNGNTQLSSVDTSATKPTLRWRTLVNSTFFLFGAIPNVPSLGADGTLYLLGPDQYLYAVAPDGTFLWATHAPGRNLTSPDLTRVATPAIGADGRIFGALYLFGGRENPQLFAFSSSGAALWNSAAGVSPASPLMLRTDGLIQFAAIGHFGVDAGIVLGPADGGPIFQTACPDCTNEIANGNNPFTAEASGAMAADGTSYWRSSAVSVTEVLADGGIGWTSQFACNDGGPGGLRSLVLFDGGVFFEGYWQVPPFGLFGVPTYNEVIGAFDATSGSLAWQYCGQNPTDPSFPSTGAIVPGGGYVANIGNLERVDPPGILRWASSTYSVQGEAVGADGTIYFTCGGQPQLSAIDAATGALRWQFQNTDAGAAASAPIIGSDGTLYFTDVDGYLNAVR